MNQYSKRREIVMKALPTNSMMIIFSGKLIMASEDESYPFKVNRNFYYLTGLEKEDMILLFTNVDGMLNESIFIMPFDETLAKWVGGRMLKEEVIEISEIQSVRDFYSFDDAVARMMNYFRKDNNSKVFFDFWHYNMDQTPTVADTYAKKLQEKYPNVVLKDCYSLLTKMRLVKDDYEVACIKKAINTTNLGINQMMKSIKPEMNEMSMEAIFDFTLRNRMCKNNAFGTIAASGPRATTLHYSDNNCIMKDGELFLCDLGATYNHYCADISRTFPVNGRFSERQKEIYNIVLQAQKIVEDNARAGVKMKDLNQMVVDFYKVELPKHGLTKDVSEYYFHSVSHHLGLDTHDVSGSFGATLQVGNVITNEPGLYIADEGIGIRIEDDLLITTNEAVNLSSEIIKTVDDIETFMNE